MEIVSIQKLWKSYDPVALPLYTNIISDKAVNGLREIKAFYLGRNTNSGEIRVFVRVVLKDDNTIKPCIIFIQDTDEAEQQDIDDLVNQGYAVVIPDYMGTGSKELLHTFYPESLESCNISSLNIFEELKEDIYKSQWVIWTELSMRAITFAESLSFIDSNKICVIGNGIGSGIAIKMAGLDSRIKCTISVFSSGFVITDMNDIALQYKASIVDAAYAPLLKAPLLMLLSSNEYNNSLNTMLDLYLRFPKDLVRLAISEKVGHIIGSKQRENIGLFINDCFEGKFDQVPTCPIISSNVENGSLKYLIQCENDATCELFTAIDKKNARMRNWHRESNFSVSGNSKIYQVDVFNTEITLLAFANAYYSKGYTFGSLVLFKNLKGSGVIGSHLSLKRLIYDNDMGTDDWNSINAKTSEDDVKMEVGPHNIKGVISPNGRLSTFKLGDAQYRGEDGLALQITMYSTATQIVKITILTYEMDENEEEYTSYSTVITLDPSMEWCKVLLNELDFKSNKSKLLRWKNVEILNIESETALIVSSMLWM